MRWFAGFKRLVRGLWPDHNPLRRRSDRIEAAVAALLLLGLLGGVPAAERGPPRAVLIPPQRPHAAPP